jgi:hypothetical protein
MALEMPKAIDIEEYALYILILFRITGTGIYFPPTAALKKACFGRDDKKIK